MVCAMWLEFCIVLQLSFVTSTVGWLTLNPGQSVCFERWGCFSTGPPFTNSPHLPGAPHLLGVQFLLSTRQRPTPVRLDLDWSAERMREDFDVTKSTRVILHGYLDNVERPWVGAMVEALLDRADQNVVVVDWARGALSLNYLQVVANARLVGAMVGAMLEMWVNAGAPPSSLHLIGHSLGAHIAGYAGSAVPGIGRITGLDPAGPAFQDTSPEVRLDPSDANFVDVIHTNALPLHKSGLGYIKPCGTVDFYPNGGRFQPGCRRSILDNLWALFSGEDWRRTMGCSHQQALTYFTYSITTLCPMHATPCQFPGVLHHVHHCHAQAAAHVSQRHCQHCVTMGYDVNLNTSGVYYVRTRSQAPFCVRYEVD